jgi:hypothetical protein
LANDAIFQTWDFQVSSAYPGEQDCLVVAALLLALRVQRQWNERVCVQAIAGKRFGQ